LHWTVAVDVIRIVIKNSQRAAEQKRQMPPPEYGNGVVSTFAQVAGLNNGQDTISLTSSPEQMWRKPKNRATSDFPADGSWVLLVEDSDSR